VVPVAAPNHPEVPRKNVPQPSNRLNWSKLPDAKVTGTIWSEFDDMKLYIAMELENIDKLFCACQKNEVTVSVVFLLYLHVQSAFCHLLSSSYVVCDASGFSLFMVYLITVSELTLYGYKWWKY
jgi:hypothetical protein